MIDLHQHSKYSDGSDNINELIKKNIDNAISIFSLTDHDTIAGCKEIIKSNVLKDKKIKFITGIEFSTQYNGKSIHLLAYDFDINNPIIINLLEQSIILRQQRINARIDILKNEFNIVLPNEDVETIHKSDNPNKVLMANLLIKNGYASTISEAIDKYLYHKMPESKLSTEYVVSTLSKANIVTSLAHALGGVGEKRNSTDYVDQMLEHLVPLGLKGLECFYSLYSMEERNSLINLANKFNLLISGGSDYHGENKTVKIGELSSDNSHLNEINLSILKLFK